MSVKATLPAHGDGVVKFGGKRIIYHPKATGWIPGGTQGEGDGGSSQSYPNSPTLAQRRRGIYADLERENDERKVCNRRGTLPEVKRENDRRNAAKRVSTSFLKIHFYAICVRLYWRQSWQLGGMCSRNSPEHFVDAMHVLFLCYSAQSL